MIQSFFNEILFGFRKRIPHLRKSEYSESLGVELKQELILPEMASKMSESNLRLSLYYAELLEGLPIKFSGRTRILDLGSKDFPYVTALATYLAKRAKEFEITGLEVDPFQIYFDFFRRWDVTAQVYSSGFRNFYVIS